MATQTFEKAMKQLEKIVEELETGDLPLEKALKRFGDGVTLSRFCSEKLADSEQKIAMLLRDEDGNVHEQPLNQVTEMGSDRKNDPETD